MMNFKLAFRPLTSYAGIYIFFLGAVVFLGNALSAHGRSLEEVEAAFELEEVELAIEKPNILLVLFDDIGYRALSSYGGSYIDTPTIDQLAQDGLRFTKFYTWQFCSLTRTSLLTGQYPARSGVRHNLDLGFVQGRKGIHRDAPSIAKSLSSAGYFTGHIGKWHLGTAKEEFLPPEKGFDYFVTVNSYYNSHNRVNSLETTIEPRHITGVIEEYSIDFLEQAEASGKPFFLNLWFLTAHKPLDELPLQEDGTPYPEDLTEQEAYRVLVENADEKLGNILDYLDEQGLSDNTIVIVISDNGGYPLRTESSYIPGVPSEDEPTEDFNGELRGFKSQLYEGGIRVPFIVHWPGKISPITVNDSFLVSTDIFPTLAEIAGANTEDLVLDGKSFTSILSSNEEMEREGRMFWEVKNASRPMAVRSGGLKLLGWGSQPGEYLLTQLFDIENDISELDNIASLKPDIVEAFLEAYSQWRVDTGFTEHSIELINGSIEVSADSLYFTGDTSRVTLAPNTRIDINTDDFTFGAWIRAEEGSMNSVRKIIARKPRSWSLEINPTKNIVLILTEYGTGRKKILRSRQKIKEGEWYFVGFSLYNNYYDSSSNKLYLDENFVEDQSIIDVQSTIDQVLLGNSQTFNAPFKGDMRDLKFFHVALSTEELATVWGQE